MNTTCLGSANIAEGASSTPQCLADLTEVTIGDLLVDIELLLIANNRLVEDNAILRKQIEEMRLSKLESLFNVSH